MTKRTHDIQAYLIPTFTALLLMVAWASFRGGGASSEKIEAYHDAVAAHVEEIPRVVGPWSGQDVAIQPAAQQLLSPNAVLQRRYENIDTGEVVQLLIVHCKNTKDMIGHYPPRCYPNAGWGYEAETDREAIEIEFQGRPMPATRYRFTRFDSATESVQALNVINFFATPNEAGLLQPDTQGVNEMSRSRRVANLGAANIQILSSRPLDPNETIVRLLIEEIEPTVRTIMEGVTDGE